MRFRKPLGCIFEAFCGNYFILKSNQQPPHIQVKQQHFLLIMQTQSRAFLGDIIQIASENDWKCPNRADK